MNKNHLTFIFSVLALAVASMFFISKQVNNAADRLERRIDFLEYRITGRKPESVGEPTLEFQIKRTNGLLGKMVDYCTREQLPKLNESEPTATEKDEQ